MGINERDKKIRGCTTFTVALIIVIGAIAGILAFENLRNVHDNQIIKLLPSKYCKKPPPMTDMMG